MAPLGLGLTVTMAGSLFCASMLGACDPSSGVKSAGGAAVSAPVPTSEQAQAQPGDKPKEDKPETIEIKLGPKDKKKTFKLELAITPEKRTKGLSGKEEIPEDGGMFFVFPDNQVQVQNFVMRDCPKAIDIIFLDKTGSITAFYTMEPQPRKEGESDETYEERLKRYSSRYAAQYVSELKGNQIRDWGLKNGQKIDFDLNIKKRAK